MNLQNICVHYKLPINKTMQKHVLIRTFQPNEVILQTGDAIDGLYLLVEGRYYVTTTEVTGKELLLRYCKPLSILGDIEILQNIEIQSDCIAHSLCTFIFIPLAIYEQYLSQDALFSQLLLKELAFKLRTCTVSSRVNAVASVSSRFAAYLCTAWSDDREAHYMSTTNIHHVAALLGTTKRHLNRVIKDWANQQIIERTKDGIRVLDWDEINQLSEGIRYE